MEESEEQRRARGVLARAEEAPSRAARGALAVELAELLERRIRALETFEERRRRRRVARRLGTDDGVAFAVALSDRFGRSDDPSRNVRAVAEIVETRAPLDFLRPSERAAFETLRRIPTALEPVASRAVGRALERELRPYLTVLEPRAMQRRLGAIRESGAEPVVHLLGEEVVGEAQAEARAELEASLYEAWGVDHLALKPSSIVSRFEPMGIERGVERLLLRAARIARAAASRPHASLVLDAESSDELEVTLRLLEALARDPRFDAVELGVALQAYLVEADAIAERLSALGHERAERDASPLRVRLVKGANLGIERVRASLRGYESAVRPDKDETDRAARRLLERLATPDDAGAVHLALGSHNLFDVAYALVHRAAEGLGDALSFELLSGMADPLARALHGIGASCRVYLPVVSARERHAAIAYLARRLDEQSAPSHFLPSSLVADRLLDPYAEHRSRFERSLEPSPAAPRTPVQRPAPRLERPFRNEPDTDLRVPWARSRIARALRLEASRARFDVVGTHPPSRFEPGFDPSREGHVPYLVGWAGAESVRSVLERARSLLRSLALPAPEKRAEKLLAIADGLRAERASLVAAVVLDAGKSVAEADAEVSEAVDFAEYYARSLLELDRDRRVHHAPLGVVLVASPWNFPLSIPCGGVCAALAAGNAVVLKPAPETPYVGRRLAEIVWAAGYDPGLELLLARDEEASLAIDPRLVDAVVLTGATETARLLGRGAPRLRLLAETGGKNAMVVSATADREQAIRDVVRSAFGYAGQKCSAASLLLLEREAYEDGGFRERLVDAASSLPVGSAWDEDVEVTPLIRPPRGALEEALAGPPEDAEAWLRPARLGERLYRPAIYAEVTEGSRLHVTELFGPVLSVMPFDTLDDALARIAATGYGLTAGIHSLSEGERERFATSVHAGNVYVNRGITGARVGRQPFGGFGLSSFGAAEKAGGPRFVETLAALTDGPTADRAPPWAEPTRAAAAFLDDLRRRDVISSSRWRALLEIARADAFELRHRLGERVTMRLEGELDLLRFEPLPGYALSADEGAPGEDLHRAILACLVSAEQAIVYGDPARDALAGPHVTFHSLDALEAHLREGRVTRLRFVGPADDSLLSLSVACDVDVVTDPVLRASRAELRYAHRSRSIAATTHRHGILTRHPFLGHVPGEPTGASRSTSKPTATTPEGLMVG